MHVIIWLKILVSWDDETPNIWKNKNHVPNHQPVMSCIIRGIVLNYIQNTIVWTDVSTYSIHMCSVYGPGGDLDSFLLQILRRPGNARSHLVFLTPKHMNLNFDDHPVFATFGCEIENMWVSENWDTPIIHFSGIFHYKPAMLGYPHDYGHLHLWNHQQCFQK